MHSDAARYTIYDYTWVFTLPLSPFNIMLQPCPLPDGGREDGPPSGSSNRSATPERSTTKNLHRILLQTWCARSLQPVFLLFRGLYTT